MRWLSCLLVLATLTNLQAQPDTTEIILPLIAPLEKITPLLPMSPEESRLQSLLTTVIPRDTLSNQAFVRWMARIYRLQAEMLEAEARGDSTEMQTKLSQALTELQVLATYPSVRDQGRFRELYRTIITEYENLIGPSDSLYLEQGEIFRFREEMFAALDALDNPLLEDVMLPKIPAMQTTVPLHVNRLVEQSIAYLLRSPDRHLLHWISRAHTYFPMIEQIFREEGVPDELKYLAMIESGLNPRARSWARASGMWQFIAPTARHYGLKINHWVDERRDPEKSTRAAAQHLKDLYTIFGDWHLALAGYNFSPGKLKRIVRRVEKRLGRKATFWDVYRYLPRETRNYVPMFIATALVVSNQEIFGVPSTKPGPKYAYDQVPIRGMLDLQTIAEMAGTNVSVIRALNPELKRWTTPPVRGAYPVRIPLGTFEQFAQAYKQLPEDRKRIKKEYIVRRGDTLGKIASRYGISIRTLKQINGLRSSMIRVGQRLIIPLPENSSAAVASSEELTLQRVEYGASSLRPLIAVNTSGSLTEIAARSKQCAAQIAKRAKVSSRPPGKKIRYRVRKGDTLSEIAEKFNVSVRKLKQWNRLRSSQIRAGQWLTIYVREGSQTPSPAIARKTAEKGLKYRVRKGDTLSEIAEKFNVSVRKLKQWNRLRSSRIRAGQILIVGKPEQTSSSNLTYRVRKGDSLYEIAQKYNISIEELKRWNGLRSNRIQPGQVLKISG